MTLHEVRKAYEQNYQALIEVITEMGGERYISEHRQKNSLFFRRLRQLQRIEHKLSNMEEALSETA